MAVSSASMPDPAPLVDRLAALPKLRDIPRAELEWLVAHGEYERHAAGSIVAPKGKRIEHLWVLIDGKVSSQADRGAGPKWILDWGPGDVTGRLPYSRMVGPPGHSIAAADTETVAIHERHLSEMVSACPVFTAFTVHAMLDRARSFKTSDMQDEKLLSLGKLAAGLAHEINNPASATVRAAKQLRALLAELESAARALGAAGLSPEAVEAIEAARSVCMATPGGAVRAPIEQADREDAIADWLAHHGADRSHAMPLAETAVTMEVLDTLAETAPGPALDAALRWIATGCSAAAMALDIERAATRIHDLVASIKRFTYMDQATSPGPVDIAAGLQDTVRVLAAKARERSCAIALDVPPDLPKAHGIGSELNQVWLNLLDNALDAVQPSGKVVVSARQERDRVVVSVLDDGEGIPPEVLPRIWDPFFTTKAPGHGTGLGLEITRQLVRQSGGDITVQSRPGRTEFRISLPIDGAHA